MTFTKLPKAISAEELLSTPLPPVKWIIPGLLPAGLALFAGPSKAGKSWLALWLCLQIAQGNPVWNREIEPRTVIYFSLEDTFNRLQNRIFQLIDGGDAPERLILQTECPSIGQGLEEQMESLIHTYRDVGLIVIDTLQKVRVSDGNGGMYANDYKEAGALKKLADKYGICILLIHHLRKQSAADPFDQISGSTGLMGVADTSWVMQRKRMSQTADILLTGRDMDDRTLHLREDNCIWTLEDEETAEEREIRAVPDYLWKAAEYIEELIIQAIRMRNERLGKKHSSLITEAKEFIVKNYQEETLSLSDVADQVGLSSSHFSTTFKQETGKSFVEFLTSVRMDKAKEMLCFTDMKASQISYEVGYKDPHYFSYLFKKTQGCTPSEYRSRRM